MKKLKMHSRDFTEENIAKLAELFPNCVTETRKPPADTDERKGENENIGVYSCSPATEKAIDWDLLKQELNDHIVEGPQERYRLDWPGKRRALLTANTPIAKTLRPVRSESVDFDGTENLFIEGDNLDALKLLQETYLGRVKMIYIDPPYNTGKDFIYRDNYKIDSGQWKTDSGDYDEEGNRLVANTETNGRFHSDWLSMMYPRLKLARNLLRDDGVIFISIDDNEQANLKRMCDEIFGEENFLANIIWEKRFTRSNNSKTFTALTEHLLCVRKSSTLAEVKEPRNEKADSTYSNPDDDFRGAWTSVSYVNPATKEKRPNLSYDLENPVTGATITHPTHAWKYEKKAYLKHVEENRLYWGKDGNNTYPRLKKFLSEMDGRMVPVNLWTHRDTGTTDEASKSLEKLMNAKVFDFPKPYTLIQKALRMGTDKTDIILDFFAGSCTTAHAVMQLNAEDASAGSAPGRRKFIMVQLPEACDEQSEAFKAGYKTIADIGRERIRRAGRKILVGNKEAKKPGDLSRLDTGFRVLKVDSSNMAEVYYTPDAIAQTRLDSLTDNIKGDRNAEDLLFQVLLDWGVGLTLPIVRETIEGREVFFVDDDALAACFEKDGKITEDFCRELAERKPMRAVFRDAGFTNDSVKINVGEIFKQMSPHTDVRTV